MNTFELVEMEGSGYSLSSNYIQTTNTWRSYEIATENYFCVWNKKKQKQNQHFELDFGISFIKQVYTLAYQTNYLNIEK